MGFLLFLVLAWGFLGGRKEDDCFVFGLIGFIP